MEHLLTEVDTDKIVQLNGPAVLEVMLNSS